jgi:hypothetical protein
MYTNILFTYSMFATDRDDMKPDKYTQQMRA